MTCGETDLIHRDLQRAGALAIGNLVAFYLQDG